MKEGVDEQKDLTLSEVENTLVCCLLTSVDAPGLVSTLLHKEMFSDAALGFVPADGDAECAPWRKCAALCSGDKAPVYVTLPGTVVCPAEY